MSAGFEREYWREASTYAALGEPERAFELIVRWHAGLFRHAYGRWPELLPTGGAALDVGCGYGACLRLLEEHGFCAWGADVSEYAVKVARRSSGASGGIAKNDIAVRTPFGEGVFDLVLAFDLLEHLERPERGLANIAHSLRPGGIAWITTPNPRFRVPPYDPWRDPTHVSVLELRAWLRVLDASPLVPVVATSFLHLPLTHRLGGAFSRVVPTGVWGPALLILAQKREHASL